MLPILTVAALATTRFVSAQNATITASATTPTVTETEPCAQISADLAHGYNQFPISRALGCLRSVPVDKAGNLLQIQGLKFMLVTQSDLNYLQDPPPGWLYPPVNIMKSLDQIAAALGADEYDNEYNVQADILAVITSVYDYHITYSPDILNVFSFKRSYSLVSVSTDGVALPDVYVTSDLFQEANSSSSQSSAVTEIDGIDVEKWLNLEAALSPWDHDPDVNYNAQFYNVPSGAFKAERASMDKFASPYQRNPGEITQITFANGTTRNTTNFAILLAEDFDGVTDGCSFFQKFCSPQQAASSSSVPAISNATASVSLSLPPSQIASISSAAPTTVNEYTPVATTQRVAGPSYYPSPVVLADDNSIAGFFPEEKPDLAVVALPTFGPVSDYEFQNTFRTFLATANEAGKSKLMIDVRNNGGGTVMDGYDFFKQLFPSLTPYGLQDIAASPLLDAVGQVASRLVGEGNWTDAELQPLTEIDYRMSLTEDLESYESWSDFFGPVERDGGNFTNVFRYNLSDANSLGYPIYGYRDNTRPQPQTFDPENIVILSDGSCGSTCAVFSEFMKSQAGVQSIAVGGRKQNGPMQSVGGTKGANNQKFVKIASRVTSMYQAANNDELELFQPFIDAGDSEAVDQTLARLGTSTSGSVNFHNLFREGDESLTPLQFIYEAADCRFFYTPEMLTQQSVVWQYAYEARWGEGACVEGSTGHPSSISGGNGDLTSYIQSCPPEGADNTFGAEETWSYPGATTERRPCVAGSDTSGSGEAGESGGQPSENSAGFMAMPTVVGSMLMMAVVGMLM